MLKNNDYSANLRLRIGIVILKLSLIGHQKQFNFLKSCFEDERLAHAFLFCGENQIGKKTLAIEFIKLLNCKNIISPTVRTVGPIDKPCGNCKSCVDIERGNFPDFLFVRTGEESINFEGVFSYNSALPDLKSGEELTDKKEIQIDQARKVLKFLSLMPYFGNYKSVIIDNAEKLTIEAQNCLLKTLEEPKGKTILILITSQPDALLQTIFSRCQQIKFFPVPAKEICHFFANTGYSRKTAEELADMADGKPGRAIELFKNPKKIKQEQEILKNLLSAISQNLAEKFAYTKNIKEEAGNVKEILEIMQRYFRYLFLQKIGAAKIFTGFYPETTENLKNYSLEKIKNIISQIEKTINDISQTNVSSKLALEVLLMEI